MKQTVIMSLLLVSLAVSLSAEAQNKAYSPLFVLPDILIYRPVGIAVTLAGVGLFTAISPLTAIAQISPPHDAFEKTADILIMGPARYTFDRPVGNMEVVR